MKRRRLLQGLAAAACCAPAARLLAAPAAGSRLLVVFMRGGYDAASLLVPVGSSFYYESRPRIAIPRPGSGPGAAEELDAAWGLHPALRDTLLPMYRRGELAFVPFAGTDDLTRSHFETQDSIELGQSDGPTRDYRTGFLNRLAGVLAGSHPIALTEQLPIIFRGALQVPNMALKTLGKPGVDERQSALIESMYRSTPLGGPVTEGFSVRGEVLREAALEMQAAGRDAISAKGFELEARRIARLMKEQFNIGFVDIGGWDTHVGQGAATGALAGRLEELGRGLAAFAAETGEAAWRSTVVVVLSEFGRTFRENGNLGTDHGHGSVYWVLGGAIRGGRVAGEQVPVLRETLFQDRDYPVLNGYRELFAGLFQRMYGLSPAQIAQVFPGLRRSGLELI